MRKIEGTARFGKAEDAQKALDKLAELRRADDNELDGGAASLRAEGDEHVVTFSFRVRGNVARGTGDQLSKDVEKALKGGQVDVSGGQVEYDEEQYVDRDSGEVKSHQANRVTQTYVDEQGQTRTRTLISKTRLVKAIDDETGEEVGKVAVRTVVDEHGTKVDLGGERGAPEQNVVVETGN